MLEWIYIPAAIERAKDTLGVKRDVVILPRHMKYSYGRYRHLDSRGRHVITAACDANVYWSSRVIWHELTHALQLERCGHTWAFSREYDRQLREIGLDPRDIEHAKELPKEYNTIPYEQEALNNERKYVHRKLTKRRPLPARNRLRRSVITEDMINAFEETFLRI